MSITVRELINNPHLKTKIIAGNEGLDNEITWAHACELSDPSTWIVGGELIMTNGIAIPSYSTSQINYLKILIEAKASGLAIGKDLHSPVLSEQLLDYANEHTFPILLTDYEIPWIAISKTVAITNANQDYAKVLKVLKLYDLIRQSIYERPTQKLLESIGDIIDCDIKIVDTKNNNKRIYDTTDKNPLQLNEHSYECPAERSYSAQIKVPTSRPVTLLIKTQKQDNLDNLVINHIATIVGLILERDTVNYERQRRFGTEILLGLMEEQYGEETKSMLLTEHNLNNQELFLVACSIEHKDFNSSWLHISLYEQKIPNILAFKDNILFILLPATEETLNRLTTDLPENIHFGISKSKEERLKVKKMYKEAVWALRSAEALNKRIVFYYENLRISPFLPNNLTDARELVYDVLGSLLNYDSNHKSQLFKTLYVFLSENQSWKKSAEILFIHKQTLVYRINRIEKILGKKLNDINNISEIWLALQTGITLDLIPDLT